MRLCELAFVDSASSSAVRLCVPLCTQCTLDRLRLPFAVFVCLVPREFTGAEYPEASPGNPPVFSLYRFRADHFCTLCVRSPFTTCSSCPTPLSAAAAAVLLSSCCCRYCCSSSLLPILLPSERGGTASTASRVFGFWGPPLVAAESAVDSSGPSSSWPSPAAVCRVLCRELHRIFTEDPSHQCDLGVLEKCCCCVTVRVQCVIPRIVPWHATCTRLTNK